MLVQRHNRIIRIKNASHLISQNIEGKRGRWLLAKMGECRAIRKVEVFRNRNKTSTVIVIIFQIISWTALALVLQKSIWVVFLCFAPHYLEPQACATEIVDPEKIKCELTAAGGDSEPVQWCWLESVRLLEAAAAWSGWNISVLWLLICDRLQRTEAGDAFTFTLFVYKSACIYKFCCVHFSWYKREKKHCSFNPTHIVAHICCVSIAVFHKIKVMSLKFWQITIAMCRCFYWICKEQKL